MGVSSDPRNGANGTPKSDMTRVCVCVCVFVCPGMMASFVPGRGEAHDRRHHPALKALTKESLRRAG